MLERIVISGRFLAGLVTVPINIKLTPKKMTIKNFSFTASAITESNIVGDLIFAIRIPTLYNGILIHFAPGLEYNILTPTDGRISASYNGFPDLTFKLFDNQVNGSYEVEVKDIDGNTPANAWINSGFMMTIEFSDE